MIQRTPSAEIQPTTTRVLVITNIFPSARAPGYGSFVRHQVESLKSIPSLDVRVVARTHRTRRAYARFYATAVWTVIRHRFDVVHAHYGFHSALPFLLIRKLPLVITYHGSDALIEPRKRRAFLLLHKRCLERSSALIAVSREVADSLRSWAPSKPINVIPCGVDTALFQPRVRTDDSELSPTKSSPGTILWIGSKTRPLLKGLDVVIDIARLVPHASFVIIGQDRPDGEVPLNLEWLGEITNDDVSMRLRSADLLILPSKSEGTPVSALEAMASGVPVLASPVGGLVDLIDHRHDGLLADRSANAFATEIQRFLDLSRQARHEMAENARRKIENGYSLLQIADRIASIYRNCQATAQHDYRR